MVLQLVCSVRNSAFVLISRAYTVVRAEKVASMIGLSLKDSLEACTRAGWKVDGEHVLPGRLVKYFLLDYPVQVGGMETGGITPEATNVTSMVARYGHRQPSMEESLVGLETLTEQLVRLQAA